MPVSKEEKVEDGEHQGHSFIRPEKNICEVADGPYMQE